MLWRYQSQLMKKKVSGTFSDMLRTCLEMDKSHFLIEAETDSEIIFFNHPSSIKTKQSVLLLAKKDI